jgi:hypothetical protein
VLFWSPILGAVFLLLYAAAGLGTGAISGWLSALATNQGLKTLRKDSVLGLFGFFVGLIGTILIPWHENTISERLASGGVMTTTTNTYQHPVRVAIFFAFLLPMVHEIYRSRRKHTA